MIIVQESTAPSSESKPVTCPKCGRGRIGSIPGWSRAGVSRRGKPPLEDHGEGVLIKCAICNSYWFFTIK